METGNRIMLGAMVTLAALFGYLAFWLAAHRMDASGAFIGLAGTCISALSPSALKQHGEQSAVTTDSVDTVNVNSKEPDK